MFSKTKIKNVYIIKLKAFRDLRGQYLKIFDTEFFKKKKLNTCIKQISLTTNLKKGTLRGFHYQTKPYEEEKIIFCLRGKSQEVIVDLRKKSKTYKKNISIILGNKFQGVYVPRGCAHAFLTLKKNTDIIYFSTGTYKKRFEKKINYKDKFFKFKWLIKPKILSNKDK